MKRLYVYSVTVGILGAILLRSDPKFIRGMSLKPIAISSQGLLFLGEFKGLQLLLRLGDPEPWYTRTGKERSPQVLILLSHRLNGKVLKGR